MRKLRLTSKRVARLLKGKPGRYRDDDVRGLLLCVVESKRKREGDKKPKNNGAWTLRYQLHGAEHWLGLGSVADFSLAEARTRARAERQKLADKRDPLAEKRGAEATRKLADAKTVTFKEAATQFFNKHEKGWRSARTRAQFTNTMATYVYPVIGSLPVDAVDTNLVLKCLEPIWHTRTVTATRVRSRIEQVLAAAAARGLRSSANPAAWTHLKHTLAPPAKLAPVVHHSAMSYRQLPDFLARLRQCEGTAARALEFTILTASRSGEVLGATWDEVDLDADAAATWTIPGQRMKSGKTHRVALSDRAVEILRGAYRLRECPYIFVGPNGRLSNMALAKVLRRLEPGVTVHGMRSAFRDWAAEVTSFPNHIIESCLAHEIGNAVERSYLRSDLIDKRARLMQAWAAHCASPPVEAGEVVPLRA